MALPFKAGKAKNDFGSGTSEEKLNEVGHTNARRRCGNLEMSLDLTRAWQKLACQAEVVLEPCCRCHFQYDRRTGGVCHRR